MPANINEDETDSGPAKVKDGESVGSTTVSQDDLDKMPHQDNPSEDDSQSASDEAPTKQDHTNAQSAMENYIDGGGAGGVSGPDAATQGKSLAGEDQQTEDSKTVEEKARERDGSRFDKEQRDLGASEEQIAAKKARDDAETDYAEHPQISRTYDGEEDVGGINKRRNAERAFKQAEMEIPDRTGYIYLDSRQKQTNIGAGEEVSQGEVQTKETIKKEDANVENR